MLNRVLYSLPIQSNLLLPHVLPFVQAFYMMEFMSIYDNAASLHHSVDYVKNLKSKVIFGEHKASHNEPEDIRRNN